MKQLLNSIKRNKYFVTNVNLEKIAMNASHAFSVWISRWSTVLFLQVILSHGQRQLVDMLNCFWSWRTGNRMMYCLNNTLAILNEHVSSSRHCTNHINQPRAHLKSTVLWLWCWNVDWMSARLNDRAQICCNKHRRDSFDFNTVCQSMGCIRKTCSNQTDLSFYSKTTQFTVQSKLY